jgi:hypothetical protein
MGVQYVHVNQEKRMSGVDVVYTALSRLAIRESKRDPSEFVYGAEAKHRRLHFLEYAKDYLLREGKERFCEYVQLKLRKSPDMTDDLLETLWTEYLGLPAGSTWGQFMEVLNKE